MRIVNASQLPAPLYLSHTSAPIILKVAAPRWWALDTVTVIRAPDTTVEGKQFPNVSEAMGELFARKCMPESGGALRYLEQLEAYIVGEFDEKLLGEQFDCPDAGSAVTGLSHSPKLAATSVQCPQEERAGGRWLKVSVLRPFAPHDLSQHEADQQVEELMRQVRPASRAPRESTTHIRHCAFAAGPAQAESAQATCVAALHLGQGDERARGSGRAAAVARTTEREPGSCWR